MCQIGHLTIESRDEGIAAKSDQAHYPGRLAGFARFVV